MSGLEIRKCYEKWRSVVKQFQQCKRGARKEESCAILSLSSGHDIAIEILTPLWIWLSSTQEETNKQTKP